MEIINISEATWIERIALKFKKKKKVQYYNNGLWLVTIIIKEWKGRTYMISKYFNPPIHPNCRCYIKLK